MFSAAFRSPRRPSARCAGSRRSRFVHGKAIRQSLDQPASCLQNDHGWNHGDFLIGNEDCLTLDVRTPSLAGKLPVLVWIHGGSNRAGGPNDIVLSDVGKQVVIVGVRYRLGIFGFLSHRSSPPSRGHRAITR